MSSDPARVTAATAAAAAPSALRVYRYALDPTLAQVEDLQRHAGAARWAFNHALAAKVAAHRQRRARVDELIDAGIDEPLARRQVKVPAVTLVAAAPAHAASGSATTLTASKQRVQDDGSFREWIVTFALQGPSVPTTSHIAWTPQESDVWTVFENSANLIHTGGDFYSTTTTWDLAGSTFWLRVTTNRTTDISPFLVTAFDDQNQAIASVTATFTGTEPVEIIPG